MKHLKYILIGFMCFCVFGATAHWQGFKGTARFGKPSNYTQIAEDGLLTFVGTAKVEQIVESIGDLGQGASAPTFRSTEAPYASWTWNINDDSHQTFQVPYGMSISDGITVTIHWYSSTDQTDDEVRWEFTWIAVPEAGGEAVNTGGTAVSGNDGVVPTQWHIADTTIGVIPGAGLAVDDIVGLDIHRIALVDGTNPDINTIHVLSVEFEIIVDSIGKDYN